MMGNGSVMISLADYRDMISRIERFNILTDYIDAEMEENAKSGYFHKSIEVNDFLCALLGLEMEHYETIHEKLGKMVD